MRIKIKKSILSSKKYNKKILNAFKRKIKRINKIKNKIVVPQKSKNQLFKPSKKIIKFHNILNFPQDINHLINYLSDIKKYKQSYILQINHRNMQEIDNVSILLLTAGLDKIFDNKNLIKNKKISPKNTQIDERLSAIGYWEALCLNSMLPKKDLNYLKIKNHNSEIMDNKLHADILDFFIQHYSVLKNYEEELFDAIYEAIANIQEHAYTDKKKKLWFLGAYNKQNFELEFLIYDTGIGIFQSLNSSNTLFTKVLQRYIKMFGSDKTLKKLCTTNLTRYKKNEGRGLGMQIYKNFIDKINKSDNEIEANLEVVTDNLIYSTDIDRTILLKKSIDGTLIRWIIKGVKNDY